MNSARFLCPVFGGFTNCAKMVLAVVSQLKQNQNKTKTLKPRFCCRNLVFVAKQQAPALAQKKQRTLIGHIGEFLAQKMVLFQELVGDV